MDELFERLPFILDGAVITVAVSLVSAMVALVLGLLTATAKLSRSRLARAVATVYTTVIRGVPDLVLMLLIFFGGQLLVNHIAYEWFGYEDYIDVNAFIAGTLTIGFIFGAYMGETFRGAILSVPVGLLEAGYAYGMSKRQVFFRILIPQMMRHALPGIGNNWLVLMKTTALVAIIGLNEMVFRAGQSGGATREPFVYYLVVAVIFLIFTTVSILGLRLAEKHYSAGVRRA